MVAVLAGGGLRASWMVKHARRWVVVTACGQWVVVGDCLQWAVVVVGGGCEWLAMVVGGGGVVWWSFWPSVFVGCHCVSLWVVVVAFIAIPCVLCEKRREGGHVTHLYWVLV